MKLLLLTAACILWLQPVRADFLDYHFILQPDIDWMLEDGTKLDLKSICGQMKYNQLEESNKLRALTSQLDIAVQLPLTEEQMVLIENLKDAIHEVTQRLIFLAKPEWNRENLYHKIHWMLPEEFDRARHRIIAFNINAAYYKGMVAGALISYFSVNRDWSHLSGMAPYKGKFNYFSYYTKTTILDACQFLPTLEFEVEARIRYLDFPGFPPLTHRFFLRGRTP